MPTPPADGTERAPGVEAPGDGGPARGGGDARGGGGEAPRGAASAARGGGLTGKPARCVRALAVLGWTAGLAALASTLYDAELVAALRGEDDLVPEAAAALARSRAGFRVLAGAAILAMGPLWLAGRPRSRRGLGACVSLVVLVAAITFAELVFAPLAPPLTTLFAPHADRGWALVAGARDEWMGVPVAINEQGLRGPTRAIPKPAGVRRVVFVGDSVTFGFQLEDDADTIPAQVEARVRDRVSFPVETVNGAVGGYSPWQEFRWLRGDGFAYEPDVVVVGFVLNDVGEKLGLTRFGGDGVGFQLEHSRAARGIAWRSATARYFLRKRKAADGDPFARGREGVTVGDLWARPDARAVVEAWDRTLPELARIVGLCKPRGIPVLLVVHPYAIQLERPELDAPQRRLAAFAEAQGIELLDLAPALRAAATERGGGDVAAGVDALYLDALHYTADGSAAAGAAIADRLVDGLYLPE